jgi:L-amino acid N-acyltransferase YncA
MRTRFVQIDDATALMNILNPEVIELEVSFDLVPKTLEEQREWIREHQGTHICLVAINTEDDIGELGAQGERILGFASVSPFRDRPAYATTVENSIYVHRGARGRGVGEVLLNDLIAAARRSGFHSIIARIVGENAGSIRLHEKCGFTLVGTEIEVGRKHLRWLDVVEYQYVMRDEFR